MFFFVIVVPHNNVRNENIVKFLVTLILEDYTTTRRLPATKLGESQSSLWTLIQIIATRLDILGHPLFDGRSDWGGLSPSISATKSRENIRKTIYICIVQTRTSKCVRTAKLAYPFLVMTIDNPCKISCLRPALNRRPLVYETSALTTELRRLLSSTISRL